MPNSNQGQGQGGHGQNQGQGGHGQNQGQGGTATASGDLKDKAQQVVGQVKDAAKPVLDQAKPALDQARQAAEQYADQAKEHFGNVREQALSGYRQAEGAIARNPAPAMLIGFGVGFGLGIVLCSLLGAKEETWQEKYLPESLQDVPDKYSSLIESLKGLPKTVTSQLPKSVSKYLG